MINAPYCDCCSTPGQWFAVHIDPHDILSGPLSDDELAQYVRPAGDTVDDGSEADDDTTMPALTLDDIRRAQEEIRWDEDEPA